MTARSPNSSGGIGFAGMLAILFIGLKLTDHIDWAWYWVLSPLWLPLAVVVVLFAIAYTIGKLL